MGYLILGLRAAFLLAAVFLCFSFLDLAWKFAKQAHWTRSIPPSPVYRFGFALWLTAAGVTISNIHMIAQAIMDPKNVVSDALGIPGAIGLTMMTVGYYMHVSAKVEAMGRNARRFAIYGGGAIVLVGIAFGALPYFLR